MNDQQNIRLALMSFVEGDEALSEYAAEELEWVVENVSAHPLGSVERVSAAVNYSNSALCAAMGHRSVDAVLEEAGLL